MLAVGFIPIGFCLIALFFAFWKKAWPFWISISVTVSAMSFIAWPVLDILTTGSDIRSFSDGLSVELVQMFLLGIAIALVARCITSVFRKTYTQAIISVLLASVTVAAFYASNPSL